MKKLSFYFGQLCVVMMAILAIGTFTSCSSDDDDEVTQGGGAPTADGKKLQFVKEGSSTSIFEYDNEGRVLKVTRSGSTILFTYSESQVTVTATHNGSTSAEVTTYMLTNGRITKSIEKSSSTSESDFITDFTYDGNGCLTTVDYSYSTNWSNGNNTNSSNSNTKTSYTWKDGNVTSVKRDYTNTSTSSYTRDNYEYINGQYVNRPITYTNTHRESSVRETIYTYSTHTYTMPPYEGDAEDILRWQGFFGKNNRNLVSKEQITRTSTSSDSSSDSTEQTNPSVSTSSSTIDYSYTFNGNALEKMFVTTTSDNNNVNVETIEFSWN